MKKINIFIIVLIISIGLNIYLSVSLYYSINAKEQDIYNYQSNQVFLNNIFSLRPMELISEGSDFPSDLMITDENNNNIVIHDLLKKREKVLIYRFSESHCDACIDQYFRILKNINSKFHFDDIILLSTYNMSKKVKIIKQTYNLPFDIYNITDELTFPIEKANIPYFFILDKDLKCTNFIAAIKEKPDYIISCIELIIKQIHHSLV